MINLHGDILGIGVRNARRDILECNSQGTVPKGIKLKLYIKGNNM